jgi:hypothetical protein
MINCKLRRIGLYCRIYLIISSGKYKISCNSLNHTVTYNGVVVTCNNGFLIWWFFIGTALQLQSIITAHSQSWLPMPLLILLLVLRLTLFLWISNLYSSQIRVESSLTLRPTVRRPVYLGIKYPSGTYEEIFITVRQLRVGWCGALFLMRGLVCRLQLLLVLASAVILGSESLGTRDRILLSQIWDSCFRRLLRLARLR